MKKKVTVLWIILMTLLMCSGCQHEKATITTTVYPVKYLVEYLAGDKVNVQYLSEDEYIGTAHIVDNYNEILKNTNLLIYIGELEPYMDIYNDMMDKYDFEIIDLAALSAINNFKRYTITEINGQKIIQENKINFYEDEMFAQIDTYNKDPFIWLDPIAMSSMASSIKDWLQNYYPQESLVIENRFKELQAILVRMDVEYQNLNNHDSIKFATIAPTFGNWQKSYGIEVYPVVLSKYGVLPSEEQLAYIEKSIKDNDVQFIVKDDTLPPEMQELYERVKTDCNLKELAISSISRLSESDLEKDKDYLTIMLSNLTVIEKEFKIEVE